MDTASNIDTVPQNDSNIDTVLQNDSNICEDVNPNKQVDLNNDQQGKENGSELQQNLLKQKDNITMETDHQKPIETVEQMEIEVEDAHVKNKRANWPIFKIPSQAMDVCKKWYSRNKKSCLLVLTYLLFSGITAYMTVALVMDFKRATPLLVIWCCFVGYHLYTFIRDIFGKKISVVLKPTVNATKENSFWIKWVFIALLVVGLAFWIAFDTSKRPNQLISAVGYLIFLFCLFLASEHPSQVKWRPVLWGLFIQLCFALLILRTTVGFEIFNWFGNLVQTFMDFVTAGVIFLFGSGYAEHFFAFKVLPIVIYFSAFVSIMYYLGAVQWILLKLSWLMQISLGTSATETMVAAGNIFIGQTEAPLLIKPFIEDLTSSELFAVMVCGFATVAGSTLGAYLSFGIDAVYLITACVMSSPCALAVAKLVYPETEQSKFNAIGGVALKKGEERNLVDAASNGASVAIFLVLNIAANLIVFISLLALLNATLSWFGGLVNFPQLTFELICSYLFVPITYLMGVEWDDCFKTAELVGVGIFINEFVAYESLASLIKARNNGTIPKFDLASGKVNWIGERSEAIMTYALCGFANVGSIGIMLGGLGSLAPSRRSEMAEIVVKAILVGTAVNLLNACVAGFLYVPRPIFCDDMLATTNWNYSVPSRLYECCSTALDRADNSSIMCNCCDYNWNQTTFSLNCSTTTC